MTYPVQHISQPSNPPQLSLSSPPPPPPPSTFDFQRWVSSCLSWVWTFLYFAHVSLSLSLTNPMSEVSCSFVCFSNLHWHNSRPLLILCPSSLSLLSFFTITTPAQLPIPPPNPSLSVSPPQQSDFHIIVRVWWRRWSSFRDNCRQVALCHHLHMLIAITNKASV